MSKRLLMRVVALVIVLQCVLNPLSYAAAAEGGSSAPGLYSGGDASTNVYKLTSDAVYTVLRDTAVAPLLGKARISANTVAASTFEEDDYYRFVRFAPNYPLIGETGKPDGTATPSSGTRIAAEGSVEHFGEYDIVVEDDYKFELPQLGRVPDYTLEWYVYGGNGGSVRIGDKTYLDGTDYPENWTVDENFTTTSISSLIQTGEAGGDGVNDLYLNENTQKDELSGLAFSTSKTYYADGTFPIIGKWSKSSDATISSASAYYVENETKTSLSIYGTDNFSGTPLTAEGFASDSDQTYYLRVDESVGNISFDLTALEPYLDFQSAVASFVQTSDDNDRDNIGIDTTFASIRTFAYDVATLDSMEGATIPLTVQIGEDGDTAKSVYDSAATMEQAGLTLSYQATNDGYFKQLYFPEDVSNNNVITNPFFKVAEDGASWVSENSDEEGKQMRSNWAVGNIALDKSTTEKKYNTIVLTLTAPDGVATQKYTFHVQRMGKPTISYEPGNTPAGLIERAKTYDTNLSDAQVVGWNNYFSDKRVIPNYYQRDTSKYDDGKTGYYLPSGVSEDKDITNGGHVYDGVLTTDAWPTGFDYDTDAAALVAYQNYSFTDPGFTITTSAGGEYTGVGGMVERRIELQIPADGCTMLEALDQSKTQMRYYVGGSLVETDTWEKINIANPVGDFKIDFSGLRVLPGTYKIEYKFTDPDTGKTTDFSRPLIVLAIPGDVDMDGVTTVADGYALEQVVLKWDFDNLTDEQRVFAYRVCNVEGTDAKTINPSDANELKNGWRPLFSVTRKPATLSGDEGNKTLGLSDYPYPPLVDTSGRYARQSVDAVDEAAATIKLKYDKATEASTDETSSASILQTGAVSEFAAPLALLASTLETDEEGVSLGEVFWVEVTAADLVSGDADFKFDNIESFTFALAYNSTYIRPADMEDMDGTTQASSAADWVSKVYDTYKKDGQYIEEALGLQYSNFYSASSEDQEWASWATVIWDNNLRAGEGTVWGKNYELTLASRPALNYLNYHTSTTAAAHYSKALLDFEEEVEKTGGTIKELVFSIKLNSGGFQYTAVSLDEDSVVLRVPFFMHDYPEAYEGENMPLVSLDLGMQELVVVSNDSASATVSSYSDLEVGAYSAQSEIYGDSTENVKARILFSASTLSVPIAADTTPYETLYNLADNHTKEDKINAQYGTPFKTNTGLSSGVHLFTGSSLPDGLTLSDADGSISGIPTEAGEYTFTLETLNKTTHRFKIVVERRPLEIRADSASSYYGESDYTTTEYAELLKKTAMVGGEYPKSLTVADFAYQLSYSYNTANIADLDKTAYAKAFGEYTEEKNSGKMSDLPLLISVRADAADIKFTHPTLTSTRDENQTTSGVGSYAVSISEFEHEAATDWEGLLANYYFVVKQDTAAQITVLQRPFVVDTLRYTKDGSSGTIAKYVISDTDQVGQGTKNASVGAEGDGDTKTAQFTSVAPSTALPALDDSGRTLYGDLELPLSSTGVLDGDEVEVSFSVEFVRTDADKQNVQTLKTFLITDASGEETRAIDVSNFALVAGSNYTLVSKDAKTTRLNDAGIVRLVTLKSISFPIWNVDTTLTYGDKLQLANQFQVKFDYGAGKEHLVAYSTPEAFVKESLYISLVSEAQMNKELAELNKGNTVKFGTESHNNVPDLPGVQDDDGVYEFTESTIYDATGGAKYYIRVAYVTGALSSEASIIKAAYSAEPLVVNKRTITLRADSVDRYYGEKTELDYSFAVTDLAPHQRGITATNGRSDAAGLRTALGYASDTEWSADSGASAPKMIALLTDANKTPGLLDMQDPDRSQIVTEVVAPETSIVGNGQFYIGIYGASHKNYTFEYETLYVKNDTHGYSTGTIHKRPIILQSVNGWNGSTGDPLTTVYTDIYNLELAKQTYSESALTFVTPTGSYYTDGSAVATASKYTLTSSTTVVGEDKLGVTVDLELLPLRSAWNSYADAYFPNDTKTALTKITGVEFNATDFKDVSNYELVFADYTGARNKQPSSATLYARTGESDYTYTAGSGGSTVYVSGVTELVLRPITDISVIGKPNTLEYTYGDSFDPAGLTVQITFKTEYGELEENVPKVPNSDKLYDGSARIDDDTIELPYGSSAKDPFNLYGLKLYASKGNSTSDLPKDTMLTHADHNGVYILVGGQRGDMSGEVRSDEKQDSLNKLIVNKKGLELHVVAQHRFFYEDNYSVKFVDGTDSGPGDAVYEYYFLLNQLIAADQAKAKAGGLVSGDYGYGYTAKNGNKFSAIAAFDSTATLPIFSTSADKESDVGSHALKLGGGLLANYELTYVDSTITVYPRPIKVDKIYAGYTGEDATDRSIYALFSGSTQGNFSNSLPYIDTSYQPATVPTYQNNEGGTIAAADVQPSSSYEGGKLKQWQWFEVSSAQIGSSGKYTGNLPAGAPSDATFYLSLEGVRSGDDFCFDMNVSVQQGQTGKILTASATVISLSESVSPSGDYANYQLTNTAQKFDNLPVFAEKRTISEISVRRLPYANLNSYTYPDGLNLSGLSVQVTYSKQETEGTQSVVVDYSPTEFGKYGLAINYYPYTTIQGYDSSNPHTIRDNYRRVTQNGEILSIAPVHDSASLKDKPTTWQYGEFSHVGKALIISAVNFADDGVTIKTGDGYDVKPKLICTVIESPTVTEYTAQTIAVKPKQLTFTLSAQSKDYDGTTRAVGSITFDNVEGNDLIYAATGRTDYEGSWSYVDGYTTASSQRTLLEGIAQSGYTFSSGSVEDGSLNNYLTYTNANGWDAGTLKFEFVDENVLYSGGNADAKQPGDADWDVWGEEQPVGVSVSNITLGGPDAANYTFASDGSKVHSRDVESTNSLAPKAIITRADRPTLSAAELPKLELDETTGTVRLLYNSTANKKIDEAIDASDAERYDRTGVSSIDDYASELHIEYAIEYFVPDPDDGSIDLTAPTEWTNASNAVWQDTYYFGGEAVSDLYDGATASFWPTGFQSEEEEAEEASSSTEFYGQMYRWTTYDSRVDQTLTVPYAIGGTTTDVKQLQYLELSEDDVLQPRESEWLFDGGFKFTVQDTNTGARVINIGGESYYYFYGYYTTDRDPIERGAYVLGKVRIAATHNYNASDALYSADSGIVDDQAELDSLRDVADDDAQAQLDYINNVAENDREEVGAAPIRSEKVLRMPKYRLDLRYAEDTDSANEADETEYDFRTLRGVVFTDYDVYTEQEQLDAVLYNDINGFYTGYFWDDRYQNALEFDETAPIILGSALELEVDREDADGNSTTALETFNDSTTIPIYVETGGGFYIVKERWIDIKLDQLDFYLDDEPFDLNSLEVEFYPPRHTYLELKWVSSDESVVRVRADGFIEFVGVGTAILTATSKFDKTDTIVITVSERPEQPVPPPKQTGIFNHEYVGELLHMDSNYFFYPEREMTRGELVQLAALFFIANDSWTKQEALEFIDIVGDEPYADAVALLSEHGVIVGVGGDAFAGERIATRAEAAAILGRMLGIDPADYVGEPTFADATVDHTWAVGYIAALRALGAVGGVGNNLYAPNRGITRAEAVTMFGRMLNHKDPTPQILYPADVTSDHWAFGYIVRAVNNVVLPPELLEEVKSE